MSPVPHGFRTGPPYSSWTRYVSCISRKQLLLITNTKATVSTSIKVPYPPNPTSQSSDELSLQYYIIATGTILFYDHLLTLADEVCLNYSLCIQGFQLKLRYEDQICVVCKQVLEYGPRSNRSYLLLTFGQHSYFLLLYVSSLSFRKRFPF